MNLLGPDADGAGHTGLPYGGRPADPGTPAPRASCGFAGMRATRSPAPNLGLASADRSRNGRERVPAITPLRVGKDTFSPQVSRCPGPGGGAAGEMNQRRILPCSDSLCLFCSKWKMSPHPLPSPLPSSRPVKPCPRKRPFLSIVPGGSRAGGPLSQRPCSTAVPFWSLCGQHHCSDSGVGRARRAQGIRSFVLRSLSPLSVGSQAQRLAHSMFSSFNAFFSSF